MQRRSMKHLQTERPDSLRLFFDKTIDKRAGFAACPLSMFRSLCGSYISGDERRDAIHNIRVKGILSLRTAGVRDIIRLLAQWHHGANRV